jgi:hypothetical protein
MARKSEHLGIRVRPGVKEALAKAAEKEDVSASALLDRILTAWLTRRGWLERPAK